MQKIIAIGGGSIAEKKTLDIDKEIVRLSGRKNPRVLFIPTASSDDTTYRKNFKDTYAGLLKCQYDELLLMKKAPETSEIKDKIRKADIIYTGGGNTLMMMRKWRRLGIDRLLTAARKDGKVLCGLSAGSLCWFQHGHSDSMYYYHPHQWDYIRVRCLGFIPATGCPHYDAEQRDQSFENMILKHGTTGIALDNCATIEVVGKEYRIITSNGGKANAYKVVRQRGRIMSTVIPQNGFRPLKDLLY